MADARVWVVMIVAALVTYAWRVVGVALSGRIAPSGAVVEWVGCVAYALLAGLVARILIFPAGLLAEAPASARLLGAGIGAAVFLLLRRNLLAGVAAGAAAVVALSWGVVG